MKSSIKNGETFNAIETVAMQLCEVTGTPLSDTEREMLEKIRHATNSSDLFDRMIKSKNYADEIECQNVVFNDTPHESVYPILKLQDKLKNKRYYDLLLALKVCNETVLQKSLVRNTPKHLVRQVSIISLLQDMPLQGNDDPHFNFNNALPYRWLVWSLKQLKLPTPSKFSDFEKLYPAVESQTQSELIKQIKSSVDNFLLNSTTFNKYHSENVLFSYIKVLLHFSDRKLEELNDEEFNILSGAMYGYSSICKSDVLFYTVSGSFAPNFIPLANKYLRVRAMRSAFLKIGDSPESRALYLNIVAITRVIGHRYHEFVSNQYDGTPEEFFNFVLCIAPALNGFKDTFNHPSNILGRMNVYNISLIFNPIIEELTKVMTIKSLFDDIKIPAAFVEKLNDFEKLSTCLISRLQSEIDSVHQLYDDDRFLNAATEIQNFIDSNYDTFTSAIILQEFDSAKQDLSSFKARSLQLIEDGMHEQAIVELKEISKIEADICAVLADVNKDFSLALELMARVFDPLHDAVAQKEIDKKSEEAAKESQLEVVTAPSVDLKTHIEMLALHDQHIIELESNVEQLEQKIKKTELELVATQKAKIKLQQKHSGPSEALRNVILDQLKVTDVFSLIEEQFPHVEFSDDFNTYVQTCAYEMPHKLLKTLFILCDEYYSAIMNGTPDTQAKNIIGQCYRANESDTTLQNASLRARREFSFHGEKKLFTRHLTIGGAHDPRKTVQVYFGFEGATLQIAYVGEHLPLSE
ncbi:hypothetical protein OCF84_21430 (plasmid) [Shewanella xiamenensis]|uniref:Uncharacterized protein n=1 Tax=Shewanella xiamenensis TaxID=332186 RepID=A0ABT6UDU8_9GAMM|nr:hypothetical protein [Shewanella xiamenensis]MDI5832561.1 hypothetical protein [Shewanella xiamenensis]WHF57821.1 hypothetical protein OCF84_21430 [Shewanella xiamenensis]